MFFHMVYKTGQIVLPFCHNPRVYGQTDRRTDRQNSHAIPRLHYMQRGKNGKYGIPYLLMSFLFIIHTVVDS